MTVSSELNVSSMLDNIANVLQNVSNKERVYMDETGCFKHGYSSWWERFAPDWFYATFSRSYCEQNKATIQYFKNVFGERKFQVISEQFGLNFPYKLRRGTAVTRGDVEKLFAGCAVIYHEDLEEFLDEIKKINLSGEHEAIQYRHLTFDEIFDLKQICDGKHLSDLNNDELKKLYHTMIPFKRIETIFLNHIPKGEFTNASQPHTKFEDFQKFVYSYEVLRRDGLKVMSPEEKKRYKVFHVIRIIKKLINFNHRIGIVFDTPQGLIYQKERAEAGGAYVIAAKAIKPEPEKKFLSRLYFLPTQGLNDGVKNAWESLADDFRTEIGAEGAQYIWPSIANMLRESDRFVKEDEQIDIVGYSLGGNQGTRIAAALYPQGRIRKLFATSIPGIDRATAEYFAEMVKEKKIPLKISYSIESDDQTVRYGEGYLGLNADPEYVKIRYRMFQLIEGKNKISNEERRKDYTAQDLLKFPERPKCYFSLARMIDLGIRSFTDGHPRESYKKEFLQSVKVHEIRNYAKKGEETDPFIKSDLEIRNRYMHEKLLTNLGYGWEEKRLKMLEEIFNKLQKIFNFQKIERFVSWLKSEPHRT